jgi:hypothetical protein
MGCELDERENERETIATNVLDIQIAKMVGATGIEPVTPTMSR